MFLMEEVDLISERKKNRSDQKIVEVSTREALVSTKETT